MKTNLILIAVLLLGLIASGSAQLVTVDYAVTLNDNIVNSEADTSGVIPLAYAGSTHPQLVGVRPDSVRIEWRATATGDSILTEPAVSVNFHGSGFSGYTVYDTIKAAGLGARLIPRSVYAHSDEMKVKHLARSAGNSLTGANKLWLHVRQYFTLPARR